MTKKPMQFIAGVIALLISISTLKANLVPDATLVTEIDLTGSNFGGQVLDVSPYINTQILFCDATNITGMTLQTLQTGQTNEVLYYLRATFNPLTSIPDLTNYKALRRISFKGCDMTETLVDQLLCDINTVAVTFVKVDVTENSPPSSTGLSCIIGIENRGGNVSHD